jgi:predicted GIY-YIG superfamily endonuclease
MTTVYLLHFARKIGNQDNPHGSAQHYLGTARDLAARLERHRLGNGAAIMAAVARAGISWVCVRQWEGGRELERQLKAQKHAARLCPICKGEITIASRHPGRRPMVERPVQFYR